MTTTAKTIAARNDVPAACRILNAAFIAARSNKVKWTLDIAKTRILDAAVDATVAASQARATVLS